MKAAIAKYDTSDYPMDNVFEMPRMNEKVPGLFKDEMASHIITEFVGLRSKMYSIKAGQMERLETGGFSKAQGVERMKKAKGVKKSVLEKKISFEDFMDCIMNNCSIVKEQNTIRSKLHRVYSVRQSKVALSPADNKRYILSNKIDTTRYRNE